MRYLKVFLLVIIFFIVMLFFVQNQASFADSVVLTLDLLFVPAMNSIPIPLYAIMLLSFTFGGLIILLMLAWDRVALSARCSNAKSRATSLEKKIAKMEVTLKQVTEKAAKNEEGLNLELAKTRDELAKAKKPA